MPREGRLQFGGLPCPVQHVRAGDVDETEGAALLPWVGKDVVQMIYAIKMESSVWIARPAVPAGVHQVATQSHVSHWRSAFRFSANMVS